MYDALFVYIFYVRGTIYEKKCHSYFYYIIVWVCFSFFNENEILLNVKLYEKSAMDCFLHSFEKTMTQIAEYTSHDAEGGYLHSFSSFKIVDVCTEALWHTYMLYMTSYHILLLNILKFDMLMQI